MSTPRLTLTSPAMSAPEPGRSWALEYIIEALGGSVTDVSIVLEHSRLETPQPWNCPLQTLEPGNRRVHVHLAVTSPTTVAPGEDLGNGDLVARYADPSTGLRHRQIWPKHIVHRGALELTPAGPERVEPDVLRSVVEDRGGGMHVEEYHGYTIKSEPGKPAGTYGIYWFNVDQRDDQVFRMEMRVSRLFARRQSTWPDTDDPTELAGLLGRRWTHGLIHLGRFEKGATYEEQRADAWDPLFGEASTSEVDLRREILSALRRMHRAQQHTGFILSLDVESVAEILGVSLERIREALGDLELEGLIETHLPTFGHGLAEGACLITGAGVAELKELEQRRAMAEVRVPLPAEMEYDVFISHASEDKEAVAYPLAEALRKAGLNVWYDNFTLRLGDSLRRSIENGLAKSRFGIVILSPSFFAKEWPQTELNGLFAREVGGTKIILPIWHNLRQEDLLRHAPMLADKVAARMSDGLDTVVKRILEVVQQGTSP